MKTKLLQLLGIILLSANVAFAQAKTEKIEVGGQCGMCKNRIEKAAKSVDGVTAANWDKKTKLLVVVFDDSKVSLKTIEQAIANAGHDTPLVKADDKTYNKLPKCCKYKRLKKNKKATKKQ